MWLQLGLSAGAAALVALAVWRGLFRRRNQPIDVGPLSESWLAEHRSRRSDGP